MKYYKSPNEAVEPEKDLGKDKDIAITINEDRADNKIFPLIRPSNLESLANEKFSSQKVTSSLNESPNSSFKKSILYYYLVIFYFP